MTKHTLIQKTSKHIGFTYKETEAIIEGFLWNLKHSIRDGNEVTIRGLGTFYPTKRKAGICNLPTTDYKIIPEKTVVKFFASKSWKLT